MNKKQFTRLFIVSFLPLLILGVVAAKILFNHSGDKYAYILCIPSTTFENCRQLGDPDGKLYQLTKSYYPAWFDVTEDGYDTDAPLSNFVMASTRIVRDARVVSAAPFAGYGTEVESFMTSLIGKRAIVKLGIEKEESSIISNDGIILFCNNLWFQARKGEYSSQCYGDGWGGSVTYQVTGASLEELNRLLASINEEVDSRKFDYNIYRVVMYPLLIYVFLIASLLVWAGIKAARFVRNG